MDIKEVARIVLKHFEPDDAVIMVAIAGGESGFNENAGGDSPGILIDLRDRGVFDISQSSIDRAKRWNCPQGTNNGPASWGLFQIFVGVWNSTITTMTGITSSCGMADWLKVPENNVRMAKVVFDRQGFNAWTVFRIGRHERFLSQAQQAVNEVLQETKPEPPKPVPEPPITIPIPQPIPIFLVLGIGATSLLLTTLILRERTNK